MPPFLFTAGEVDFRGVTKAGLWLQILFSWLLNEFGVRGLECFTASRISQCLLRGESL